MSEPFWDRLAHLVETSEFVVERARGSAHPRYPETTYPLDYGHLTATSGGDGNEVDAWRGSREDPSLDAVICAVDLVKRDTEVKVLLGCTAAERQLVLRFHQGGGMGAMLIERPPPEEPRTS